MLQVEELLPEMKKLHNQYGDPSLAPIYGAGQITNPKLCLIFMNPTGRNVSSQNEWQGLRAPWLGTKRVWKLLHSLNLFTNTKLVEQISSMRTEEWTEQFAEKLYQKIAKHSIYITNIAKCTFPDARHVSNSVYKVFLPSTIKELQIIKPEITISFGNQVSSVLLDKSISVSNYLNDEYEEIDADATKIKIFPTYYPVGQGSRNIDKAIKRLKLIMNLE